MQVNYDQYHDLMSKLQAGLESVGNRLIKNDLAENMLIWSNFKAQEEVINPTSGLSSVQIISLTGNFTNGFINTLN